MRAVRKDGVQYWREGTLGGAWGKMEDTGTLEAGSSLVRETKTYTTQVHEIRRGERKGGGEGGKETS